LLICLNLDVTRLVDEDVACLAKFWGYPPALPELMSRHRGLIRNHVGRLAAGFRLGREDTQDAIQNALVRMPEVVRDYDHDRANWALGSFRSFLTRAVIFASYKFIRALRSRTRREDHSARARRLLEGGTVCIAGKPVALESREPGPVVAAER